MISSIKKNYLSARKVFILLFLVGLSSSFSYLSCEAQSERKFGTVQALLKKVDYSFEKDKKYVDLTFGTEVAGITFTNTVDNLSAKEGINYIANTISPALDFVIFVNEPNVVPIVILGKPEKVSDSVLRVTYLGSISEEQKQNLQKLADSINSDKSIGTLVVKGSSLCADAVLNPASLFAQKGMEINKNPSPKNGWDDWKVTFKDITSISVINSDGTQTAYSLEDYSKYWLACPKKFKSGNGDIAYTDKKTGKVIQLSPVLSNPVFDMANKAITFEAYFMGTYNKETKKSSSPDYPEELKKTGHYSLEKPLGFMVFRIVTTSLDDPEFIKLTNETKN